MSHGSHNIQQSLYQVSPEGMSTMSKMVRSKEKSLIFFQFPDLYKCYEKGGPSIPVPDLASMYTPFGWKEKILSKRRQSYAQKKAPRCTQENLKFSSDLIGLMRDSMHPVGYLNQIFHHLLNHDQDLLIFAK